jgi:hypothetical protein
LGVTAKKSSCSAAATPPERLLLETMNATDAKLPIPGAPPGPERAPELDHARRRISVGLALTHTMDTNLPSPSPIADEVTRNTDRSFSQTRTCRRGILHGFP